MQERSSASAPAVTIAEAAGIANRSTSWIRRYREYGPLEAVEIDGLHGVTLTSLHRLIRKHAQSGARPQLRLVVDNTK